MDNHEQANGENHCEVISGNPEDFANIIDHSDNDVENKKENYHEFSVDEDESLVDGEHQEDDTYPQRDNQGRKNISTLTSRHYASHVRVFKGM